VVPAAVARKTVAVFAAANVVNRIYASSKMDGASG
jgi:hypothetical protein